MSWYNYPPKVLLMVYILVGICTIISKSVMAKVGENNGKDCPDDSGPIIATVFYGITCLFLFIFSFYYFSQGYKLYGVFFMLLFVVAGVIIAGYSIFITKQGDSPTECLPNQIKQMIDISEIALMGILTLFTLFTVFSANV